MDAVARDFAARKADLVARQREDLRERQKEACDALREHRDGDYKELLQQQRDERAALKAAHAMGERAQDLFNQTLGLGTANENTNIEAPPPPPVQEQAAQTGTHARIEITTSKTPVFDIAALVKEESAKPDAQRGPDDDRLTGRRDPLDLGAAAIGSAAGNIADQLGELFAPTPPELRAARALEEARREAQREERAPAKDDAWSRAIEAALRLAEQEREQKRSRDYWTERERTKEGRDR
jgi:hypothetical protein